MKLAIFSPIPPQATGIADYAHDLIIGLAQYEKTHITVLTMLDSIAFESINNIEVINTLIAPHSPILETHDFSQYDQIIYHLGNNGEFHAYMLPVLKQFGGIVHLHDLVLQQVLARETQVSKYNRQGYLQVIRREYGNKISQYMNQLIDQNYKLWQTEYSHLLPCFETYLRYADACIVHSDYAYTRVNNKLPGLSLDKVPQLYNIQKKIIASDNKQGKTLKLGIFGGIERNRKLDTILKVLSEIVQADQQIKFELIIVGAFSEDCQDLIDLPAQLGIADKVSIHHRVEQEDFFQLLNSIDLLIALREPTTGETSAVVMQALQLNKLVIVSDVGWYSELPELIDKASNQNLAEDLHVILKKYLTSDSSGIEYLKKQQQLNQYTNDKWDYAEYIVGYMHLLEKYSRNKAKQRILNKVYLHLNELELTQNLSSILRISEKLI